jgi:hypothetical protein
VTWQQFHLPVIANARGCVVHIARDDARRVLFATLSDSDGMAAYRDMTFFVSDDGGATFHQNRVTLPLPQGTAQNVSVDLWPTRHYVFAATEAFISGQPGSGAHVHHYWRSADNGRDWQPADTGLDTRGTSFPTLGQNDATWVTHLIGAADSGIWLTQDAGDHWRRIDPAHGGAMLYANTYPPTRGQLWYAIEGEQSNHMSAWQSVDGLSWAAVPRLPAFDGLGQAAPYITRVIGETPGGDLLALGASPTPDGQLAPHPDNFAQAAQWVWVWNPRQRRWMTTGDSVVVYTAACGLCPGVATTYATGPDGATAGTYVWLYDYSRLDPQGRPIAPPRILREFAPLPASA